MWDPVTCHECHTLLEVTSLRPLTLGYLEDDWKDDEEFEEDEEEWN